MPRIKLKKQIVKKKLITKKVVRNQSAWLILSTDEKSFDKRLNIRDLFVQYKAITRDVYQIVDPTKLWIQLERNGISVHPSLIALYKKDRICIWCGDQIIRISGVDEENFEDRCRKCGYPYEEK